MDGTTNKFGLHDSIGHQISRAARMLERRVDDGLRRFGMTRIGWCILLSVEEAGKTQPSEIAGYVGIDRTATSRALRQLESEGLIAREIGQEDRRTTRVSLTDEGRRRLYASLPLCRDAMGHFQQNLSDAELRDLKLLLTRLTADGSAT